MGDFQNIISRRTFIRHLRVCSGTLRVQVPSLVIRLAMSRMQRFPTDLRIAGLDFIDARKATGLQFGHLELYSGKH